MPNIYISTKLLMIRISYLPIVSIILYFQKQYGPIFTTFQERQHAIVENSSPEIELNMFPNPATQTVKVEYELPGNVSTGILRLIDNSGRQLKQYTVDKHTNFLALDVSSFKSGTYHYFIEYDNTRSVSKKLVVR